MSIILLTITSINLYFWNSTILEPGFMSIFSTYRIKKTVAGIFFLCCIHSISFSQARAKMIEDTVIKKFVDSDPRGYSSSGTYYITSPALKANNHVPVIRYIDDQHTIIRLTAQKTFDSLQSLVRIVPANNKWKLSPPAEKILSSKTRAFKKIIVTARDLEALVKLKNTLREFVILQTDNLSRSLILLSNSHEISKTLLPLDEIIFIDVFALPREEINIIGYDRSFNGINAVDYLIPGANGNNIVAGVKEQKMDEADIDLYKRVLTSPIAGSSTSYHATLISTIIGGAGNSSYNGRGIANKILLFPSSFDNLFADDTSILHANKVSVQNHSYGTIIQQFYGAEAVSYDALCSSDKDFVAVFSAGNQGTGMAGEGKYANIQGFANITGNFKMAKNIITVGAIDNKGNLPAESSSGPLYDGRIAPQLIALGPNGSSDAAAIVSGTIAVIQQVYSDSNQNILPPASLVKALLYNNAEDIHHTGIDFKTGYGLLDSYASIKSLQQKKYDGGYLIQGEKWTKTISVPANSATLKVTVAWTDTVATINNNKAMVNDLDLEVKELKSGIITRPWILNTTPNPDSLSQLPARGRDSLNTAEIVTISFPQAGDYEIKVTAVSNGSSPVPFNMAYKTDTLHTFRFVNPLHASDVNRDEDEILSIKWKTIVADTNEAGNLFISYNHGMEWHQISSPVKLYTNQFSWHIKDTNAIAQLKMETEFGNFLSAPFAISTLTRPVVDFLCIDSTRLSWKKHFDAIGYKIFALTDSPFLKHLLTVTDTFFVFKKEQYPYNIYAVEPLLNDGVPAARSIAQDITLQGVSCFYKTFYYNLLEQNKFDLILELSAPGYSDSVYFEKVTANGNVLEIFGTSKVNDGQPIYIQAVNTQNPGTIYLRARIKLKSGAIVYTEIISLQTSGNKYLLFYPNPASQQSALNFVLQQSIPFDSKLLLFDMSGRLIRKYESLPASIDTRSLATGMYIYKLFTINDETLETGKIVIQ